MQYYDTHPEEYDEFYDALEEIRPQWNWEEDLAAITERCRFLRRLQDVEIDDEIPF